MSPAIARGFVVSTPSNPEDPMPEIHADASPETKTLLPHEA